MSFWGNTFSDMEERDEQDDFDDDYGDDDDENPWHAINTSAGAYCIVCGRGIRIGESAWWNHETRDVACSEDGEDLFDQEEFKGTASKIIGWLF